MPEHTWAHRDADIGTRIGKARSGPVPVEPTDRKGRAGAVLGRTWTFPISALTSLIWTVPVLGFAEESQPNNGDWHYGGSIDLSYAVDFNFPGNNLWRSKTTSNFVNEPALNMAVGYVKKEPRKRSRWGFEFGLQEGNDTDGLVPLDIPNRDRPIAHVNQLKHFSRANVSYLAPIGNGLTLTSGLLKSFIGYQSIYSRYNLNYTRSYMADNAPYFVFGLGATYPVSTEVQLGFYVVNGYNYLSSINNQPSYGAQAVWKPSTHLTLTENLYYGPDQSNTSIEFWRFFPTASSNGKTARLPSPRPTTSVRKMLPSFPNIPVHFGLQERSMLTGT